MKTGNIFWGTLLIVLGGIILLNNFIELNIHWADLLKLWPFVFILWGLSIIVKGNALKGVITALIAFVLAISIFASVHTTFGLFDGNIRIDWDDDEIVVDSNEDVTIETFSKEYDSSIETAVLNFDAGAGSFKIKDTTNHLIEAITKSIKNNYSFKTDIDNETASIDFNMKRKKFYFNNGSLVNKVDMKLNSAPDWTMYFDLGAAELDFDLSKYKIKELDLEMGAASLWLKLGAESDRTNVTIDAGASAIEIFIPEEVGCEVKTSVALTSRDFDRFNKVESNLYRTNGFDDTDKKIYLLIDTGVSSIEITRYGDDW